ncbi:nuclear transport factor 2 family protein [Streptomyces sp. SID14478]|uniref:nuclear transport factor 2 family protein n=1 Tax=Streptomyces sp. SID14478 TaxID=2706073 RepID=UPI0013DB806C|nr:nuclear transport factor 2 family protein [Streptomyces sp. SID14478]NEB80008.1 nuclear transport factor 2 family protein [Streptomyces sp. SID14478]
MPEKTVLNATDAAPASHRTHHPHADLLARLYQDLAGIGRFLHPDAVLHPALRDVERRARPVEGRDAVIEWERDLITSTGCTLDMQISHIAADEHFGSVHGTLHAVFRGYPFSDTFCGLWRFRDGLIVEHWENIADPHRLARAVKQPELGGSRP